MSKYNNIKSIQISNIPKEEIAQAIKEWAEGSVALEKLLRACYLNGIETSGCHAGGKPYLSFYLNDSKNEIIKLLDVAQQIKGSTFVFIPDGGNPYSGPSWDKPNLGICFSTMYKEEVEDYFNKMFEGLLSKDKKLTSKEEAFAKMLDLYDYFDNKDSCLQFRTVHTEEDKYKFQVEAWWREKNFEYFNSFFQKAGLKYETCSEERPFEIWSIEEEEPERLVEKMKESIQYIVENYSLEPPASEMDVEGFNPIARLKKKEFGNTPEGEQKFNEWLKFKREERRKLEEMRKRMCSKKESSTNATHGEASPGTNNDNEIGER